MPRWKPAFRQKPKPSSAKARSSAKTAAWQWSAGRRRNQGALWAGWAASIPPSPNRRAARQQCHKPRQDQVNRLTRILLQNTHSSLAILVTMMMRIIIPILMIIIVIKIITILIIMTIVIMIMIIMILIIIMIKIIILWWLWLWF